MGANKFVTTIKAIGSENDVYDLDSVYSQYTEILNTLSTKDKAAFSLNVLCILCRNIEKVPTWRDRVNNADLLKLSIECVRHCSDVGNAERVKILACIYHIHKHVIKQNSKIPPELILKMSYMPFECEEKKLLKDYCKTYWSILADRFIYIERLKGLRTKLLTQLIEDITKVIYIYDSVQFCSNILIFVVKKLYYLYNNVPEELNRGFGKIFDAISITDVKKFKKLKEENYKDLYMKFNDCLYVIIENSYKVDFKESIVDSVTRTCISLIGHRQDIYHCLQTFYLNTFCCIFNKRTEVTYVETVLNSLETSCESTAKIYSTTLECSYPFLGQLLRVFIENNLTNLKEDSYENIRSTCLNLILYLMSKLKLTQQLTKCENCNVKTGLHDALRLSFLAKNMLAEKTHDILPIYYSIIQEQYEIISELKSLHCVNSEKYHRKIQTDNHNTAIILNKSQEYEYSIKLFDIYLKSEIKNVTKDMDLKNISRALYNRGICELDYKVYDDALKNAYLSLIFSLPEGLKSEKYMSLIMDIKAKLLKVKSEEQDFQTVSVMEACKMIIKDNSYENLIPFFKKLKFSEILKHEFKMYSKLWPSIVPIGGVWTSLNELLIGDHEKWIQAEDEEALLEMLCDIILETATVVRSIHDATYTTVVKQLVDRLEKTAVCSVKGRVIYASLLFLKSEYDIAEATLKYGWKSAENTVDPEQDQNLRTIEQEHAVLTPALRAVEIWTEVVPDIKDISDTSVLANALQIAEVFVHQLLYTSRMAHALQLASVCCSVAEAMGNRETYIRNAGVMIYHASRRNSYLDDIVKGMTKYFGGMIQNESTAGVALGFACEVAMYQAVCGARGVAGRMVRLVQARLYRAARAGTDTSMELALGRLLEAESLLCSPLDGSPSELNTVNVIHRHYLALSNGETRWANRRRVSLDLKRRISVSGAAAVRLARDLRLWRRARAAAAAITPRAAAVTQATLFASLTNTHAEDALIKIDNRLKYILGLQTPVISPELTKNTKLEAFTPSNILETIPDCFKRAQASPSLPCTVIPAYYLPPFLTHTTCTCHVCHIPEATIMTCRTNFLEASMYYRTKEFDVARNYFEGTLKSFDLAEKNIKDTFKIFKDKFNNYIYEDIFSVYERNLKEIEVECLIEVSYMELAHKSYEKANEYFVRIHEIITDMKILDTYLLNDVSNLMITAAHLRIIKKPIEIPLEAEFENLTISSELKTPVTKIMPKITAKVVKDEEIPKRRKVIKLNLDEVSDDVEVKVEKTKFKVPEPITVKPSLEIVTPRPTRSRPGLLIQQATVDAEPTTPINPQFHTPCQTPNEQFFTPMSTLKTYSKQNVVKKLEDEFSTPRVLERSRNMTGSLTSLRDKRSLKRATSPGKLLDEKPVTRTRKPRQPVVDKKT